MYSCCKTQIFAGTTTPKLIDTSADKSDQSFLMIWADKSFISSGQVVYFQTVSSHSQKFFKIGFLKNFVKLTKMYLCRSLSLSTMRHPAFLKRDSDTVTLLWILWIFWKQHFYRTLRLLLSLWNVFAISINLILFSQCGFSRNKNLEAVLGRCSSK